MTAARWTGGPVGGSAKAVLAPNPGPMTLEGTNTWVLRAPGAPVSIVVDPGPAGATGHLAAVAERAGTVALTVLTHHHGDHTGAVEEWMRLTGSPVRGAGHGRPLRDGERLALAGLQVEVLHTPGHTQDSLCLLVEEERVLLTGDTVLGRGTTVVPWPEGDLGAYLESLERIIALVEAGRVTRLAPGHGPVVTDPHTFLTELRAHRHQRLEQVRAALDAGARTADEVVRAVYGELSPTLARAAAASARAQLAHLGEPTD